MTNRVLSMFSIAALCLCSVLGYRWATKPAFRLETVGPSYTVPPPSPDGMSYAQCSNDSGKTWAKCAEPNTGRPAPVPVAVTGSLPSGQVVSVQGDATTGTLSLECSYDGGVTWFRTVGRNCLTTATHQRDRFMPGRLTMGAGP